MPLARLPSALDSAGAEPALDRAGSDGIEHEERLAGQSYSDIAVEDSVVPEGIVGVVRKAACFRPVEMHPV